MKNQCGFQKNEVASRLPTVKRVHHKGGVVYQDGQFDDARLAVNIAQTAIEQGATVLNYFKVSQLHKDSDQKISGVTAIDQETSGRYVLNGKVIINAT